MSTGQTDKNAADRSRGRRRTFLVNPAFQWKYAAIVVVGIFFVSTLMTTALFSVLHQQARARTLHMAPTSSGENTLTLVGAAGAFAIVLALAFGLWSIVVTHRICGPLSVMRGYVSQLKEGHFPEIRPARKKDEFPELYEDFRSVVRSLKARKLSELDTLTEVLKSVSSASQADHTDHTADLNRIAAQVEGLRDEITCALCEEPSETNQTTDNETRATESTPAEPPFIELPA